MWNRDGIIIGQQDIPLNERGRQEALQAACSLGGTGLDAIYSSPLARSRETAQIVGAHLGLDVILVPELAERNWGVFEGRPRNERDRNGDPENGESKLAFMDRINNALQKIEGQRPLLVTHSGVIRAITRSGAGRVPHAVPIPFLVFGRLLR